MDSNLDKDFVDNVFGSGYLLEDVLDWVSCNLNPEDVFDEDLLRDWALDNDFVEDL